MRIGLFLARAIILALVLTEASCNHVPVAEAPVLVTPSLTMIETPKIKSQIILTGQQVSDFGWLSNGQVYYGIQQGDLSNWPYVSVEEITTSWFAYDSVKETTTKIQSPYPSVSTETHQAISKHGNLDLMSIEVSPSGEVLLYASISGSSGTPAHDQVPLIDLYVAKQQGKESALLSEDFYHACGIPNSRSQWLENETLVMGSCQVLYGIPGYFVTDLLNDEIQRLIYETEDGDLIYPTTIALAHRTPLLAIESGSLWVTPANITQDQSPIKLGKSSLLVEGSVSSPLWSADDQWIYYWRWEPLASSYDEITDRKLYPWRLERINIATRHSEIVLSEDDLRLVLGDVLYEMNMDYGINIYWRLSKDGKQILLYDTKPTLFLIYW